MLKSLFNKIAGLKACNFIKKCIFHRCFSVNIAKFLRTAFFQNTSGDCFLILKRYRNQNQKYQQLPVQEIISSLKRIFLGYITKFYKKITIYLHLLIPLPPKKIKKLFYIQPSPFYWNLSHPPHPQKSRYYDTFFKKRSIYEDNKSIH